MREPPGGANANESASPRSNRTARAGVAKYRCEIWFLISLGVGIVATLLAIITAYFEWRTWPNLNDTQILTRRGLEAIDEAITAYQKQFHSLPESLAQLRDSVRIEAAFPIADDDVLLDWWQRPYLYSPEGNRPTVLSYGKDGKPGGQGLDCDLTNLDPRPPGWCPTLMQFLLEMETDGIVRSCLACGVLAFFTALVTIRNPDLSRRGLIKLSINVAVTIAGACFIAAIVSVLHIPTGH